MEKKKIGTITLIILILIIVITIGVIIFNFIFNTTQLNKLNEETNRIIQIDLLTENVTTEIKTKGNYGKVEKAIKEYILELQNLYNETDKANSEIDANKIFSAEHLEDKKFDDVDKIIEDYEKISRENLAKCKELITEENVLNNIKKQNIKGRAEYFNNLYKEIMLSDAIKEQYIKIKDKIEKRKDELDAKIVCLKDIEEFLEKNKKYWNIKDEKIEFNNITKMTEYYNLVNLLTK